MGKTLNPGRNLHFRQTQDTKKPHSIMMEKLLICLSLVLISCQESDTKTQTTPIKPNERHVQKDAAQLKIDDFGLFWNEFRSAISMNDSLRIIHLTEPTLKLFGRADSDPQMKLTGTAVAKAIFYVVNKGGYFDEKNNKDVSYRAFFLQDLNDIDEFDPKAQEQWIKDFVFTKTAEGWKLSVLYTNTVRDN
jgi:hypothetical protein